VVQPHRYTRVRDLFTEFCTCFNEADGVIVSDIYSAGEEPIAGITRDTLIEGLRAGGHKQVLPLSSDKELAGILAELVQPGDMVVCLGAGSITKWAYALPAELEQAMRRSKKAKA
jgi:UDP-N-acetylmuramate--alanine ligase